VGLVLLASGSFAGFVAPRLVAGDDPVATSSKIVESESVYRLGIVSSLVMMIALMFYALLLYRLLRPIDKNRAMTMVGLVMVSVPIGLWLIPLGLLVLESRFFPRFLGILLLFGSPGYLVLFVQAFFVPGSERTLWTNPFLVATHVSELALLVWLLVKGVNVERWEEHGAALDS
jgi:hypothetical protein